MENNIFSIKYFTSYLQESCGLSEEKYGSDKCLIKVPNITIGHILAAHSLGTFTNVDILKWIHKGKKLTPLIEKQFDLYRKLAKYLIKYVMPEDVDAWHKLLNYRKYVWPTEGREGWASVFGDVPELCQKINAEQTEEKKSSCDQDEFEILNTKQNNQEHTPEEMFYDDLFSNDFLFGDEDEENQEYNGNEDQKVKEDNDKWFDDDFLQIDADGNFSDNDEMRMDTKLAINSCIERTLTEVFPRHFLDISRNDTKDNSNIIDFQNSIYRNAGPHTEGLGNYDNKSKGSSLDTLDDRIYNCLDLIAFGINKSLSPKILSKCLQMGHGYQDQEYMKRNMLIPVVDMPFMCSICGLQFENKMQIADHITIHKDDKMLYNGFDYFEYIVQNSINNNTALNILNTIFGMTPNIDIVPIRSQEYSPIKDTENVVNTSDMKVNECSECGKTLSSSYSLKRHKLVHALVKPFTCNVCGTGFTEKSTLKRHLHTHFGMAPNIDIVPIIFQENSPFKDTQNAVTTSDMKLNECSECGKTLSSSYSLKRHKLVHATVKPFTCNVCGKGFTERSRLKRHKDTHADIRPF